MKHLLHPTFCLFRCAVVSLLLFAAGITYGQTSPVLFPAGGFKIDGALRANVTIQAGDWAPRLNSQAFTGGIDSFVLNAAGTPEDAVSTRLRRDEYNNTIDNIFTQGSKFNDYISALRWGLGGAPNKNDIHNGMFHASADASGNQWVFIGGDRLDVSGTSYIDFEFLQGTITTNASTFTGSGPAGGRFIGDINISMEYNNGGSAPKVVIYRWAPTNEAGTAWAWDSTGSAAITQAYAKTNLVSVDAPFGAFGGNTYQAFAFVESAINITELITAVGGNCAGLSIKTLWIKTKASSSSTAALKDFMDPISLDLTFGGIDIHQKGPVCLNGDVIALTATPAGGTFSGPGVTGTNFTPTASDAGVGSHRIIYTASAGVNCEKKDTMWIVVRPLPAAVISGTTAVCQDATSPFVVITGSGGTRPYTFSYTINGGSTLQRTTTGSFDTVRIAVATSSANAFTYALTGVSDANCSNTASGNAVVTINAKPTAAISGATTVCKDAASPFIVITGSGGTRPYTFSYTLNGGGTLQRTTTGTFDTVRIAVPTGTAGTFTYVLTGVSDANCSNTASGSAAVTVNPKPTASISGATTVCKDATSPFIVFTGAGGTRPYTFSYTLNGGGTLQRTTTGSFDTARVAVPTGTPGTFTYVLTGVSDANCSNTASGSAAVTVNSIPTAPTLCVVQPTLCGPATGSITVLSPTGDGYQYSKDGGATWQTSNVFSGLAAGSNPSIVYKTGLGCISEAASCSSASICSEEDRSARTTTTPVTQTEATARVLGSATLETSSSVSVSAMPNPFNDKVRFMITNPEAGSGTLDIYNMTGQKIKTVYQGNMPAGVSYFDLTLATRQTANLIYVLRIGDKKFTGKLLQLNTH